MRTRWRALLCPWHDLVKWLFLWSHYIWRVWSLKKKSLVFIVELEHNLWLVLHHLNTLPPGYTTTPSTRAQRLKQDALRFLLRKYQKTVAASTGSYSVIVNEPQRPSLCMPLRFHAVQYVDRIVLSGGNLSKLKPSPTTNASQWSGWSPGWGSSKTLYLYQICKTV